MQVKTFQDQFLYIVTLSLSDFRSTSLVSKKTEKHLIQGKTITQLMPLFARANTKREKRNEQKVRTFFLRLK